MIMDEQLDVLPYSLITVCLYAPINVISDYHRYGLRVEEGRGWWENGPLSFPEVVGICYCLRNIHFNCVVAPHQSQVSLLGDLLGNVPPVLPQ